ncbi:uncharacterized protein CLAFUR5_00778 [Fulvia fulva]|uniref:Uncharacterized protein n=1 Tax=Passalora fulva TaxID=5499 RepID=A0A9Q8LA76_PASFU|nr:uncharacterized protein CLAFUR5_00778 [Fulvia fulva]KAK4638210.1 hypothetical protein CLAFUR0_00777 [Fulvia fulva]UJO13013.1 hypothetical protein CLAFUR5_00778 [Fulvia fulva]
MVQYTRRAEVQLSRGVSHVPLQVKQARCARLPHRRQARIVQTATFEFPLFPLLPPNSSFIIAPPNSRAAGNAMGSSRGDASIQQFFLPTPSTSPTKRPEPASGDGFTAEEVQDVLAPKLREWYPEQEYEDCEISALEPGPRAVTFMGRVGNIFDVANTQKTPRSAKGCIKICLKDGMAAITVRIWYASRVPSLRLGSLVSIWTSHISNGENGTLSSSSAPLFASLFPERDRNCHMMIHENSDVGTYKTPLAYRPGLPLNGLMTLQNFIDGGYDVVDAKVLVVVKSIGAKNRILLTSSGVTRKDESVTENINLQVQDDTAEATLGLWGTAAASPLGLEAGVTKTGLEAVSARRGWKAGETILLIQAPGWKIGRTTYLSLTAASIVDVNPSLPDTDWLRHWSIRQRSREATNPAFPEDTFDLDAVTAGPIRCLFTLADLDDFARCAPSETFQGYLSLMIMETKLLGIWKRHQLLSGECCNIPIYANALTSVCKGCDKEVGLRLNPKILGQVMDETAVIASGRLLFCDAAWRELLGRDTQDLLKLGEDEMKYLSDRLLFCRITVMFGWTSDETKAGGRICVMGIRS